MRRVVNAVAAAGLAVALAGLPSCDPVQNPYGTNKPGTLGTSSFGSNSSMPTPSSAGTIAGGTVDSPKSQGLSDYLSHHSLPLVSAQVVTSPSGGQQVILFGFVASDYGKADAEKKARHYMSDPNLVVDNRIKISPELAGSKGNNGSSATSSAYPNDLDPYAATGSAQDYQNQNNLPPGAQAYAAQGQQVQQYQQYQQYNSGGSPSMLTMILPLLMGGGMTMGGGTGGMGMGIGGGGFGSGYAPSYGGYGYPTYPPPMPGSGFGSSGSAGGFSF